MDFNQEIIKAIVEKSWNFIPNLISALIILLIFYKLSSLANNLILKAGAQKHLNESLVNLASQIARISVFIFGLITSLNNLGIDLTAITASLGLTGFALGFALKDAISNIIAGVMVILYKTFSKGDHIEVSGDKGIVVEVNLRYTVIESTSENTKSVIFIPNSIMLQKSIKVSQL